MARIDDYIHAIELSSKELSAKDPDTVAEFSRAILKRNNKESRGLSLKFLNRYLSISWPDLSFSYDGSDGEVPIEQQVLLLHYLTGAWASGGPRVTGEWTSFQDLPDGRFYMDSFIKRAKEPLLKTFGDRPARMVELAINAFAATPLEYGDFSVMIDALPLVPVALILWEEDEEFSADANILFDKNISMILSAEDIAWLGGMVVYPLIGMGKGRHKA
jgi:hypothetical protein